MARKEIGLGVSIHRITPLMDLGRINGTRFIWGVCSCGTLRRFNWMNVKFGKSKSCGCLPIEINTKHGFHNHVLYGVWEGIIRRCYNKNSPHFNRYGGRGVTVCDEWKNDPLAFIHWATDKWQKGLALDKDKLSPNRSGDIYSPEYCCFLTPKENSMYRNNSHMVEYNGEKMCIAQWADRYNIKYSIFNNRVNLGWDFEKIISTPARICKVKKISK